MPRSWGFPGPWSAVLLTEARQLGVVEITVHDPEVKAASLLERLRAGSSIKDGILVEDGAGDAFTNQLLSQGAVELLEQLQSRRLGVGWGHLIGQLVTWLEKNPRHGSSVTDICPLVGNASIPARNYQSNENVRLMAQQLGASPHFLYLPALPESLEEKQILCSTEIYRQIHEEWERIDTALVNIGDYPSSPDFASLVRYGGLLQEHHACGRMLVYYFNEERNRDPVGPGFCHPGAPGNLKTVSQHHRRLLCQYQLQGGERSLKVRHSDPHRGPVLPHPFHFGIIVTYVTSRVYFISLRGFTFVQYA